ncbi:hypothetical protein M9458_008612, partial [Cirrhinus mrigala]
LFTTMYLSKVNKPLRLDPPAPCLIPSVTEYSAAKGSSSFSPGRWPGMNTARLLVALKQGKRSLEDYTREYLAIANDSDLPDCMLIDFFCSGINQPLKSRLVCKAPSSSFSQFLDFALLCVGSPFTVGVAEEERDKVVMVAAKFSQLRTPGQSAMLIGTPVIKHAHEMAAAPVRARKMVAKTMLRHVTAAISVSSQVTAELHESSYVSADHPQPRHATSDRPEPRHVSPDLPEPHHVSSDCPESRHVTSDHLDSRHVLSAAPRSSRSVLRSSSQVSSVRDPPLVSSRATGIPKPAPSSPIIIEILPPAAALPLMAIWCMWAAHCAPEASSVHESAPVPLEVAAPTAEPPKGASSTYELSACPVMTLEAVCEPPAGPEPATETVYELSPCPELATEAMYEPPAFSVLAMEATYDLSALPATAKDVSCECPVCPVLAMEAIYELFACHVTAMEAVNEPSARPVTAMEAIIEVSARTVTTIVAVYELLALSIKLTETVNRPTVFPASLFVALSASSVPVFPRSQSMLWVSAPPWWAPAQSRCPDGLLLRLLCRGCLLSCSGGLLLHCGHL